MVPMNFQTTWFPYPKRQISFNARENIYLKEKGLGQDKGGLSPRAFRGNAALLTPGLLMSGF